MAAAPFRVMWLYLGRDSLEKGCGMLHQRNRERQTPHREVRVATSRPRSDGRGLFREPVLLTITELHSDHHNSWQP